MKMLVDGEWIKQEIDDEIKREKPEIKSMKAMTIVVYFKDGQAPEPVTFNDTVLGGEVTAMAAYDVMHTMEIAESVIDYSSDPACVEAREKIDKYIVHGE